MDKLYSKTRLIFQVAFFALTNGYIKGFTSGKIYTGNSKKLCVPGLNCYSCPGALYSCPVGSLQAVMSQKSYTVSLYIIGMLTAFGTVFGRFICGFMCPFGLVQDLLYKIPIMDKKKCIKGHKILKNVRYIILILFVILLPTFFVNAAGGGNPWFCEYICPSGTLFGAIPLLIVNKSLRALLRWRFFLKISILCLIVIISIKYYRPFCKYLCPLGLIYGWFNKFSFVRISYDKDKCNNCGACNNACKMGIDVKNNPNSCDCIRCFDCVHSCKEGALQSSIGITKR
ncbi:MAG: 4Fe-4S binding protein [Lachnospiraceae bacterium]|nr:4Fe-4S binding protein [Lachnospiraceae bacterium]